MVGSYKELLENETLIKYGKESGKKVNFKLSNCLKIEDYIDGSLKEKFYNLKEKLGDTKYKKAKKALIRFSFFIQTTDNTPGVKSDTTIYRTRWDAVLVDDDRFADYDECLKILEKLCDEIVNCKEEEIKLAFNFFEKSTSDFLPIDYIQKKENIHTADNVQLKKLDLFRNYCLLKEIIFNEEYNTSISEFKSFLKKINVKAYKTDRSKTGSYKTNREYRWETIPNSHQFSLFCDCVEIEYKLLLQICQFKNIDSTLKEKLKDQKLISDQIYRCPIVGRELDYYDLRRTAADKVVHGRSEFQVGHLQPLKNGGSHIASNIGWQTEDGNRIQGNLSLNDVDKLLKEISRNRPELFKNDVTK
ncbi:TPA: hypothetical protein ACT2H1_001306 [Streptococcus suis]